MTEALAAPLVLAFATGLLGSFGHCLGMCGPLAATVAMRVGPRQPRAVLRASVSYHAGRVVTYAVVGALMGLTGSFVDLAGRMMGLQRAVSILAGVLMVATGVGFITSARWLGRAEQTLSGWVLGSLRGLTQGGGSGRAFASGLWLGLLPCGLSYSIFLGAAATGGLVPGALYAASFGAGTVPALVVLGMAVGLVGGRFRVWLHRGGGLVVAATGLFFVISGVRAYAGL